MGNRCIIKSYPFSGEAEDIAGLFRNEPYFFFLDSSLKQKGRGRFSFIGFDPFHIFQSKGKNCLPELRQLFDRYQFSQNKEFPFFPGGAVGYFAYDVGLYLENIKLSSRDDLKLPDCMVGFYDSIIAIDHAAGRLYVLSTGLPEKNHLAQKKAQNRFDFISRKLSLYGSRQDFEGDFDTFDGAQTPPFPGLTARAGRAGRAGKQAPLSINPEHTPAFRPESRRIDFPDDDFASERLSSNFTKKDYLRAVKKALDYIRRGDIYQVNLSQRFVFDTADSPELETWELYKILRRLSPSSFSAYFHAGNFQIISSSPENFLHVQNGIVQTRPMKGTRPRGKTLPEDRRWKKELLNSKKERAELLMVTDLERNDLGRVCRYGSVHVNKMRVLEEYKTVFQTTSTVEGILAKDKDNFDLLAACFPSGSVTGCPKIRAMEIIEELEPHRRGPYTGSLGYIGFDGTMDFNILIRTLIARDEKIYFHAGGGIVSDSAPENEYEETLLKARALSRSLACFYSNQKILT